ncbi:low temperature requirement protein A [Cellulomonas endophytica]|uniref:low temperature requirement protein A n=1 Tax=Cellulomonas endophytica TaxID=2494735 RepID=UPI0013E923F6|nr:low temperature requirement protein A [Cellulomonas endophytica]
MSQQLLLGHRRMRLAAPLAGRDPDQRDRGATPLELFFDLVFVVAVALAAEGLHHSIAEAHATEGLVRFAMIFCAIYWAWVNFTWLSSAYDTDDVLFRALTFLTMTGALVFAAGVPRVMVDGDFSVVVAGYTLMRVAQILTWLRVARGDAVRRATALRYAGGLAAVQTAWVLTLLALPTQAWLVACVPLAAVEVLLPLWAERTTAIPWHADHIAERYGLFMIIVLGESVLATARAVQTAIDEGAAGALAPVFVGGLLVLFSIWWVYFERPGDHLGSSRWWPYAWSYLHLVMFASVAAVGAGLALVIEESAHHGEVSATTAAAAVTAPYGLFLLGLWGMYVRRDQRAARRFAVPVVVAVVGVLTLATRAGMTAGTVVLAVGITAAALVVVEAWVRLRGGDDDGVPV